MNASSAFGWWSRGISYDNKWSGHGHEGFRCKKPKNMDWWNHLTKVEDFNHIGGEIGMVSDEEKSSEEFWIDPKLKAELDETTREADSYCDEWEPVWYYSWRSGKDKKAGSADKDTAKAANK